MGGPGVSNDWCIISSFFSPKKLRGPEGGPERGPEGGVKVLSTPVSFALVVLVDQGVLSILSLCCCDPTFKQQAVMPITAKSVDEVRSWLIDNGFAADTFEYASKLTVR